jgi:hypothetical protein
MSASLDRTVSRSLRSNAAHRANGRLNEPKGKNKRVSGNRSNSFSARLCIYFPHGISSAGHKKILTIVIEDNKTK